MQVNSVIAVIYRTYCKQSKSPCILIMSSDESDYEISENNCLGYQYEPEFTEEELSAAATEDSCKDNASADNNIHYCTCGNCGQPRNIRERVCCKQFEHYHEHYLSEDIPCISHHPEFELICLNKTVLETAYVAFMRYKKQSGRAPDTLSNR